ncbi:5-methylthioadenosine/S-adenosylhomocysteine deaminase 2 [uncultured Desulfatiglans sp.]|nr:5-methylthioadenosine/S-adenosylhomocysteine deaminase 2 [uncultured Desulfatiglans sp.]
METLTHRPDLVISGGTLLTMVDGAAPLEKATIRIGSGRIIGIDTAPEGPAADVEALDHIDATGCIVMPGLVNAHTHAAMTLFRGYADDLPLQQWLFERIFPAEAAFLSDDTVYWGALLGCLEMIASGTTCFADGYFFQDATARAVHEAGLRAVIAQGVIDFPAPGVPDPADNIREACSFMKRWQGASDRITPGIFCHSPMTCSAATLKAGAEAAERYGTPFQIHLSETRGEVDQILHQTAKRPVFYLDDLGVLNDRMTAAHAVHLDRDEMGLIKERGVRLVNVPESNMKLASGVAPVIGFLRLGIPMGLGTDGCCSNNNLDMFQEMDTAAKVSKVFSADPVALTARDVLRMATSLGAAVLGLEDRVGTVEAGKAADLIVIDLQKPHLRPVYDPYSALVYAASGGDVRDTIVQGRILMRNRSFVTLDANEIMRKVSAIAQRITAATAVLNQTSATLASTRET